MSQTLIVHGRYVGRTFIPDSPLPDAEGSAELVVTPIPPQARGSVADSFGTAPERQKGDAAPFEKSCVPFSSRTFRNKGAEIELLAIYANQSLDGNW